MRILHTSDWHVGKAIRGRSRADEHTSVLDELVALARAHDVDLVLVAGDLFDVAAPSPESEQIVYRALLSLSEVAPVVLVAGNHDNPRRLLAVAPLLELGRVVVASRVERPEEGGVLELPGLPVRLALLPWVSRRGIVSASDLLARDADEHSLQYAARLARVVEALCAGLGTDTINLVVAHLTVAGAQASGSERGLHTVIDYALPALAFPGELSYVALGHYHRQQRVPAPSEVWYSGSPLQLDFGEAGEAKGALLVEAEPGLPARVTPLPLTSGRRLVRLRGTLEEVAEAAAEAGDAYVRVELEEAGRAGLADEVRSLVPGAVDVVLSRRHEDARRESPRRLGREPGSLFAEYLAERGNEDERLLRLFDDLLEEAYEAGRTPG